MLAALFQQDLRPQDIGPDEHLGAHDGAVHMGFRGKMDNSVHLLPLEDRSHHVPVAHVPPDKPVAGISLDLLQVLQVPGIGQGIEVRNPGSGIPLQEMVDEV